MRVFILFNNRLFFQQILVRFQMINARTKFISFLLRNILYLTGLFDKTSCRLFMNYGIN